MISGAFGRHTDCTTEQGNQGKQFTIYRKHPIRPMLGATAVEGKFIGLPNILVLRTGCDGSWFPGERTVWMLE